MPTTILYPNSIVENNSVTRHDGVILNDESFHEAVSDNNQGTGISFNLSNSYIAFGVEDISLQANQDVTDVTVQVDYSIGAKTALTLSYSVNPTEDVTDFAEVETYNGSPTTNAIDVSLGVIAGSSLNDIRFNLISSNDESVVGEIRIAVTHTEAIAGIAELTGGLIQLKEGEITF
jgi:hypothetical protein